MKKVVIYGLGNIFHENKDSIINNYNIVGYCDKDESKLPKEYGVYTRELLEYVTAQNALILLCLSIENVEILKDVLLYLVEDLQIPISRIKLWENENPYLISNLSHAQFGEDIIILMSMQASYQDITNLKYCEIGINHAISGSNTYLLYQAGMRGILVDPLPWSQYECNLLRKEDTFLQVAVTGIAPSKKKCAFYIPEKHSLSSISYQKVKRACKRFNCKSVVDTISVRVMGVNELLQQIGYTPDILIIDAEGEDLRILQSIDYKKHRPLVIMAELGDNSVTNFMKEKGYATVLDNLSTGVNGLFFRTDFYHGFTKKLLGTAI